jgi:rRNA-processing protein FCF1
MAALNMFKQLTKSKKHTKEQAAKLVVEQFARTEGNEVTPLVPTKPSVEDMLNQLLEQNKKQEEFNKALLQKLDQQEHYIKESIEKRDRLFLESLKATREAAIASENKKMKNRVKRFFGIER